MGTVAACTSLHFPADERNYVRVLIADDNASMRRAIRLVLEKLPNIEICAMTANGTEAVDAALALHPEVLVLDVVMPGLNGVEAAGILKKRLPRSKIILFTMYDDAVSKNLTKLAGVDIVLEKSRGLSLLTQKINSVIAELN